METGQQTKRNIIFDKKSVAELIAKITQTEPDTQAKMKKIIRANIAIEKTPIKVDRMLQINTFKEKRLFTERAKAKLPRVIS